MSDQQIQSSQPDRPGVPFVSRVKVKNYKSIATCDVGLDGLTILVGRNGSGKSNFLDALRFVVDGLQTSLDHAIRSRGGIDAIRRRSTGHPRNFTIELELRWKWVTGRYGFEIASRPQRGFAVRRERLALCRANGSVLAEYDLKDGAIYKSSIDKMPPVSPDRLYLVNAAGLPEFRGAYDALLSMGFYNLNPEQMRELQSPDSGELLHRDGSNVASVIARLEAERPEVKDRIKAYLTRIVPGISDVARTAVGPKETIEFRQEVAGATSPWQFYATNMSDGTLRALGALVAVTQLAGSRTPATLAGIEEPETALHPAAAGALMGALREAASRTQIVVTTHSPDLLEELDLQADRLLIVQATGGATAIGPVDPACLQIIRDHLDTPGELLRMDQLQVDPADLERQTQLRFDFDGGEDE
jgi:predicted ATPase